MEFAAYQLKVVAQIWFEQCKYSRPIGAGRIVWETFMLAFLDRFFPRELKEAMMEEFINLKKGDFSAKKFSLNLLFCISML